VRLQQQPTCKHERQTTWGGCNFHQLFHMAAMIVKLQALQCSFLLDMSHVTETKLRELREMVKSPDVKDEVTRVKGSISVVRLSWADPI
jgi:hypothetical protein